MSASDYLRDLEGDDPVAAMRASIEATLERFRIHFDTWRRQSVIEEHVPEALAAIETYEQDGATWAPTTIGSNAERCELLQVLHGEASSAAGKSRVADRRYAPSARRH